MIFNFSRIVWAQFSLISTQVVMFTQTATYIYSPSHSGKLKWRRTQCYVVMVMNPHLSGQNKHHDHPHKHPTHDNPHSYSATSTDATIPSIIIRRITIFTGCPAYNGNRDRRHLLFIQILKKKSHKSCCFFLYHELALCTISSHYFITENR